LTLFVFFTAGEKENGEKKRRERLQFLVDDKDEVSEVGCSVSCYLSFSVPWMFARCLAIFFFEGEMLLEEKE